MHHFHRSYGKSQFFNFRRVARTLRDLTRLWFELVVRRLHLRPGTEHSPRRGPRWPRSPDGPPRLLPRARGSSSPAAWASSARTCAAPSPTWAREVTAVDSLLPDYGGNLFNLAGYEERVRINIADVRGHGMEYLVRGQHVLFNLAGQVSHIDSMSDPVTDLEINCTSQLRLLEAVRRGNPELKVVYAGTRQVYGRPLLPAGRRAPPAAAGRRQRHQQDLRRVLPPGLPPGVRHPRLLAAADQHLRAATADPAQPPGLHRLVRAPGRLRRGDPALRRRAAEARLQPRRRRGRRLPARRGHATPRTARCSTWATRSRCRCSALVELLLEVAGGGRYRIVPFPRRAQDASTSATSTRTPRRCSACSAGSRGWRCATGSPPPWPTTAATASTTCERPLRRLQAPGRRAARLSSTRRSRACSTRAGSCSVPRARPSSASWPPPWAPARRSRWPTAPTRCSSSLRALGCRCRATR